MQLELRRLVALNPNEQLSIRRLFSEGNYSSHRSKTFAHIIYNLTCV